VATLPPLPGEKGNFGEEKKLSVSRFKKDGKEEQKEELSSIPKLSS